MKRTNLIALAALALVGSACAEPDPALLVTGHVPALGSLDEETGAVSDCAGPTSIDDIEIFSSTLFINLGELEDAGNGFFVGLVVENRLVDSSTYSPSGFDRNQRLNQNHIEVQSYEVTFDDPGFENLGDQTNGELSYPSSGIVTTDGTLWVPLELFRRSEISPAWTEAFARAGGEPGAIVPTFAEIQVRGKTIGGTRVRSNILTMPISVCADCSQSSTPLCVPGA